VNYNLLSTLQEGACVVFSDTPRPADVARIMSEQRVTTTRLWPPQQLPLAKLIKEHGISLPHLRRGLGPDRDEAGQAIPPSRRMGGVLGMTECFGPHSVGITSRPVPEHLAGYWGHELAGVERKIVEPGTGAEIKDGRLGDLYIRGFSMMDGYYRQERSEIFEPDGFFNTGDRCRITAEGALHFDGRSTEMIKTSGANVSPREVELALQALGGIQEAVVFGVPDRVKGEIVAATIVPSPGASIDVTDLRDRMKGRVSPYKVPTSFLLLREEEVPRTGSGKAIKARLREMLLERLPAQESLPAGGG
jgi:acyl-CoA synthetase (AMP-forming)/AMP-acid ligase II